jgi:hypothetical protein
MAKLANGKPAVVMLHIKKWYCSNLGHGKMNYEGGGGGSSDVVAAASAVDNGRTVATELIFQNIPGDALAVYRRRWRACHRHHGIFYNIYKFELKMLSSNGRS